jgi:lipopolysaccharide export system protein LptA
MKKFLTMALAAMAFVASMSSCSKDDDEPEVAVAAQVVGSYAGNEIVIVDNEESSNDTKTYEFTKATETSVDMSVPEMGMGGMMTIPAFPVKGIVLTKNGNTITGKLATYNGTVKNAKGDEKAYTVSDITVIFSEKTVVATFALKYGSMPFVMMTTFTGTKK